MVWQAHHQSLIHLLDNSFLQELPLLNKHPNWTCQCPLCKLKIVKVRRKWNGFFSNHGGFEKNYTSHWKRNKLGDRGNGEIPSPKRDWDCDFRPDVAKQHDVSLLRYAGVTIFGVLASTRAVSWLDNNNRKLFECFNEDLPKTALVPATEYRARVGKAHTTISCVPC